MKKIDFKNWLQLQEVDFPQQVPQQVMVAPAQFQPPKLDKITPQELRELQKDIIETNDKILKVLKNFDPFVLKLEREFSNREIHPNPPFIQHLELDPDAHIRSEEHFFTMLDQIKSNLYEVNRKLNRLGKDLIDGAPDERSDDELQKMANHIGRTSKLAMLQNLVDNLIKLQDRKLSQPETDLLKVQGNNFKIIDTMESMAQINFPFLVNMVSDLKRFEDDERLSRHLAARARLIKKGFLKPDDQTPLPPLPKGIDD